MTTLQSLDEAAVVLRHRVRCVHDTTGAEIRAISARLITPDRMGWSLAVKGADVIVSSWTRHHDPAAAVRVAIEVTSPALRARLVAADVELDLLASEQTHRFVPTASTVTIDLVDDDGVARIGQAVVLQGIGAATVVVPETPAAPGTYRTDPTTWTPATARPTVQINGQPTNRVIAVDPTQRDTRIRLIDPNP